MHARGIDIEIDMEKGRKKETKAYSPHDTIRKLTFDALNLQLKAKSYEKIFESKLTHRTSWCLWEKYTRLSINIFF